MEFSAQIDGREEQIKSLFAQTFAASEGADEGRLIAVLVERLLKTTPREDLFVFTQAEGEVLIAAAIFSRLTYSEDARSVFILSPMAVATERQKQGVGQALLKEALSALSKEGVDVAITYGDPAFYGKVGFEPLDEDTAAAPLPLSQPVGWIGQPLQEPALLPLKGRCTCVAALDDPAIW